MARPLDAYTANLWSACWTRRLLTAWTGAVVRVRRVSDGVEQDFTDTGGVGAFCGAAVGVVVRLYDQTGNGRDLYYSGTAYSTAAPIIWTGSALVTAGDNVAFRVGSSGVRRLLDMAVRFEPAVGEMFAAVQMDSDPVGGGYSGLTYWGSHSFDTHYPYSDNVVYEGWGSTARKTCGNPTTNLAAAHCLNILSASADWRIWVGSEALYSTSSNTVGWRAGTQWLGGASTAVQFLGVCAGLVLYTAAQTDRSSIRDALITVVPPDAMTDAAFTPDPVEVEVGETAVTTVTPVLETGASVDSIEYESSATGIATVDGTGVVTGVAAGTATITATITASGAGLTTTELVRGIDVVVTEPVGEPPPAPLPTSSTALPVIVVQLTVDGITHHFSDIEYGDGGTRWHDARVVGDIAYSRSGSCVLWAERRGSGGLGNIELINEDGALDFLLTNAQVDGWVDVFEVYQDQPMNSATQIAAAVVGSIEGRGERTARIVTGDVLALLDVPMQASLYEDGDGADTLIGRPRPTSVGNPLSCPIVLVNEVDYEYDVHDADTFSIVTVRDSGYPLSEGTMPGDGWRLATSPGIHGIELLQTPVGRVVADVSATTFSAETIIGAAEGDFATDLDDWTVTTEDSGGGTATAEWDATGKALIGGDKLAESSGIAAYGELEFPTGLFAGQRYDYSLDFDLTVAGVPAYGLLQVFFRPDSLIPGEFVNLDAEYATAADSLSGTFTAPADGKFVIRCGAGNGASAEALIDNVRLDRVSAGGNTADVIELLLARAGIGIDQIDADSLAALAAARPWACSYWSDGAERIVDVMQQVLDSVFGWMYTNAAGQIAVGLLEPPEAADEPVIEITTTELAGEIEIEPDLAPGLSTTVAGARNWYRYGEGELADALSDADRALLTADYRIRKTAADPVGIELGPRAGAAISVLSKSGIPTLLDDAADLQSAADYLAVLYPEGVPRRFYKIPVFLSRTNAAALNPGVKLILTYDRFGCDAGRELRLVQVSGRAGDDLVVLRCWGSAVDE